MKQWLVVLMVISLCTKGSAQSQQELYNSSVKAYESKDYKAFLKITKSLDSIRPFHPSYTYNLASANALNDNPEEALIALRTLVLMNNTADFENDEDFKSIKQDEGFRSILELRKNQGKLLETSKSVVTLDEKELHPEGVTFLANSKTWLASSIRKRKIVAFDIKTGQCTDWLKGDNMLSVLSMKADAGENFLWVATASFPEMEGFDKVLEGKAEVLKVDTRTKKIVKRFSIPGNHVFGDLIVAKNGIVYVSDSAKPIVYKIEKDEMIEFISFENQGYNLQGLAFNDMQSKLFVSDYLKGIVAINVQTKAKNWLPFPDYATPKGIDGVVFYKNSLIGIQNGVKPIRITQFQLNVMQTEITDFKLLDNNRPEFNEPALATIIGQKLYFFANSPWTAYDKNGVLDVAKVLNPVLFSCKLD